MVKVGDTVVRKVKDRNDVWAYHCSIINVQHDTELIVSLFLSSGRDIELTTKNGIRFPGAWYAPLFEEVPKPSRDVEIIRFTKELK